jgi:hypothetical protein
LSRACLGKIIVFQYVNGSKKTFFSLPHPAPPPASPRRPAARRPLLPPRSRRWWGRPLFSKTKKEKTVPLLSINPGSSLRVRSCLSRACLGKRQGNHKTRQVLKQNKAEGVASHLPRPLRRRWLPRGCGSAQLRADRACKRTRNTKRNHDRFSFLPCMFVPSLSWLNAIARFHHR